MNTATHHAIIKAAGLNYGASLGAPVRIQQRFHARFMALLMKHDVSDSADRYCAAGAAWWNARPLRGTSVDW